ncbi:hypothetical protein OZK63_21230 [Streptomyces sp. UMAF16]|nr:hypothetical protein [Streptomyces sp. UMAF16]
MTIELTANTPPSTSEQRAQLAELIGDAQPATNRLLEQLAESVRDRREHEHPKWEDLYCLNLGLFMGERMAPVLRRLLNAETAADTLAYAVAPPAVIGEHSAVNNPWANALDLITPMAEVDALRTKLSDLEERTERSRVRLAAAEADLLAVRGLLSPAGGPRRIPAEVEIHERVAPAVDWLLARVAELESERHTTNASLSEAAEALRANRDRIKELEQLLASKDRPVDEDPIAYALTPKAEASADRLARLLAPTQALRDDAAGEGP